MERMVLPNAYMCSVTQTCLTLLDPMDCSLPGSSVDGIFPAKILDQVAISYSRVFSRPKDQTIHVSCVSCIGRGILYHWATWEAHPMPIDLPYLYFLNDWVINPLCEWVIINHIQSLKSNLFVLFSFYKQSFSEYPSVSGVHSSECMLESPFLFCSLRI